MSSTNPFDEIVLRELRKHFPQFDDEFLNSNSETLLAEIRRRKETRIEEQVKAIPDSIDAAFKDIKNSDTASLALTGNPTTDGILQLLTAAAQLIIADTSLTGGSIRSAMILFQGQPGETSAMFTRPFNLAEAIGALYTYQRSGVTRNGEPMEDADGSGNPARP